ncbi:hypothetical protein ACTD5D_40295 [Nocardia takedensis]|uniref:hypothetical protein n=1 Tax=Nocardia takedensis TaxID=259390 RepID=UPI003F766445
MTTDTPPAVKGLLLFVYRNADSEIDTTHGGITAAADRVTLVGILTEESDGAITRVPEWRVSMPTEQAPPVIAVVKHRHARPQRHAFLVPVEIRDGQIQTPPTGRFMFGGNYAATTDSRVPTVLTDHLHQHGPEILPVHDRAE